MRREGEEPGGPLGGIFSPSTSWGGGRRMSAPGRPAAAAAPERRIKTIDLSAGAVPLGC
jgi:hypothetical protein